MSENNSDEYKKREERVSTALPVDVGFAVGITRNISASGIFFEIDANYAVGSSISFSVKLDTPSGHMNLKCRGEIVRIEPRDARVGVAVMISESAMEAVG